jgi:hypothetical protein
MRIRKHLLVRNANFFAGFLIMSCAESKRFSSIISQPEMNWVFLDKFVFDTSGAGSLSFTVQFPKSSDYNASSNDGILCLTNSTNSVLPCFQTSRASASLLFYSNVDGSASSWFSVYNDNSLTCEERASRAATQIPLVDSGEVLESTLTVFPSAVPHFWYVVIAHCSRPSIEASVQLHFLNSRVPAT